MSRIVPIALLVLVGVTLIALGLWWNTWWTITGGVLALTGAAWLVTEPRWPPP